MPDIFDQLEEFIRSNNTDYSRMLYRWCDNHWRFKREFGMPYRRVCDSVDQLVKQILYFNCHKHKGVYITPFEYRSLFNSSSSDGRKYSRKILVDYNTAVVNKVYWDFDYDHKKDGTLEDAWEDVHELWTKFPGMTVLFTGNRGFNCYIRTAAWLTKNELAVFQSCTVREMELETADLGFTGDIARIMRLPFTVHPKTEMMSVPVSHADRLKDVLKRSGRCPVVRDLVLVHSVV